MIYSIAGWIIEKGWVFVVPFIVWNIVGFRYIRYSDMIKIYGEADATKITLLRDIKSIGTVILVVLIAILWQLVAG